MLYRLGGRVTRPSVLPCASHPSWRAATVGARETRGWLRICAARLRVGDEFPPAPDQLLYVHVVLREGTSWWPAEDPRVPQLADPGLLDVETVTRLITVPGR